MRRRRPIRSPGETDFSSVFAPDWGEIRRRPRTVYCLVKGGNARFNSPNNPDVASVVSDVDPPPYGGTGRPGELDPAATGIGPPPMGSAEPGGPTGPHTIAGRPPRFVVERARRVDAIRRSRPTHPSVSVPPRRRDIRLCRPRNPLPVGMSSPASQWRRSGMWGRRQSISGRRNGRIATAHGGPLRRSSARTVVRPAITATVGAFGAGRRRSSGAELPSTGARSQLG